MISPCVGICEMRPDGFCRGCLRTLKEIAEWTTYTEAQRQQIMCGLDDRAFDDYLYFPGPSEPGSQIS
jgi:predicted Fe-S protein YdhL (DUF1289 family)